MIYLNKPSWRGYGRKRGYDDFVVVDGLQRITALQRFLADEIPVFGSLFSEYTDRIRLNRRTMRVNINTLKTKAEVLRWYIQFNSGGTPHTSEEINRVKALLEVEEGGKQTV